MEDSPLSQAQMATAASRVRKAWRLVQGRAPEGIQLRVQEILADYDALGDDSHALPERRRVALALEGIEDELRGRSRGSRGFYEEDRLGVIRRMEPVSIRETIDDERVREHLRRYESRANRSMERLTWFLKRAGVSIEEEREVPPWEQPYADFADHKEHVHDD